MYSDDIKKVLDSPVGRPLKDYLMEKLEELRTIESLNEKDVATHMAMEVKAQKRAYLKLKEIMGVIMSLEGDRREKDPRDSMVV